MKTDQHIFYEFVDIIDLKVTNCVIFYNNKLIMSFFPSITINIILIQNIIFHTDDS